MKVASVNGSVVRRISRILRILPHLLLQAVAGLQIRGERCVDETFLAQVAPCYSRYGLFCLYSEVSFEDDTRVQHTVYI